ncbi:MAG: TonB-dependent receptor [Chryseolinea sp.]
MIRKLLFTVLLHSVFCAAVFAQDRQITGTVTGQEDGTGVPGVNVVVQGTTKGTTTDVDGKYSLQLAPGENTLVFSFVGFKPSTVDVAERTIIDVALDSDVTSLNEVVVIGYGSMEEKDLTSAISTVKGEEIVKTPTSQAMQALQGKVPGVQIISSGVPGASPTVRVRGMGSFPAEGDSDPLYVVDGMFFDNIDFLNTADIETISILKDASAASIYGVRAANGVVLITTKSGSYKQKTEVDYNGYYGVQVAQNVLKMANSQQFTRYALATGSTADASFINNAFQRYGRSRVDPNVPNVTTDWYDEVLRTAAIQNHSVSVNGGNEDVKFSVGASYFDQEGLLKVTANSYERLNFRSRIDFKATERLTIGGNVNLSNATQYVADNSAWFNSFFAVPIIPVNDELNTAATPLGLSNAQQLGYRSPQNPFFNLHYTNYRSTIGKILGNFYFDYQLIPKKLTFRTAYNYNYESITQRNVDFAHNNGETNVQNALKRRSETALNQILDNTLTYTENFGAHNLTILGGYSYRSEVTEGNFLRATNISTLDPDEEQTWFIPNGTEIDIDGSGDIGGREFGVSYFGRVAYNYDDRYLLYGTFRRDGTNKFQQKWGNFLTFGAGWVISEEDFFKVPAINYLKLRGSWGQLGNDGIAPAVGQPTVTSIATAVKDALVQGIVIDNTFDLVNVWETVEEINVGITSIFFDNRLTLDADYYIRDTHDAVTTLTLPAQADVIRRNVAEIRNSGLEVALNWNGRISPDLKFTVGGNIGTLKNEVLSLGGQNYLNAGQAEFRQRSIVGEAINAFYGWEIEGVYQNQAEITNSLTAEMIQDRGIVPGDFHFKDQNGDRVIDASDRVVLGNILPSFTYGFNLGVTYKGFELSGNIQGMSGHSILNRKRGEMIFTNDTNIDAELANKLWTGEGTSNKYPSAAGLRKSWNLSMSDYFVEDGSYFRLQNVRLSYHAANKELFGVKVPDTRIIFTAERPITVFSYNGFNPEVGDYVDRSTGNVERQTGVDRQTYPIPAVYTVGLNVKF